MRLKELTLKNFRSYEKAKITFDDGTVLIAGDIGSGKSSILMAIEFALFGLGDLKTNNLLRKGTSHSTVTLVFEELNEIVHFRLCRIDDGNS